MFFIKISDKFFSNWCTLIFIIPILLFSNGTAAFPQTLNIFQGDVTGLPIPRFVSAKSNKMNVRRGPNSGHQIDWVYKLRGVPLKVTAEYENWRKIEDFEGEGGWAHARLLSGTRFVIFLNDKTTLKRKPNKNALDIVVIGRGVIAKLISSSDDWGEVSLKGYKGWVLRDRVWGLLENEIIYR